MKKNTQAYIEKNEKAYRHYITEKKRRHSMLFSCLWVGLIALQMIGVRYFFLKSKLLEEAGKTVIENREVLEWVNEQMRIQFMGWGLWGILAVTALMMFAVIIFYICIKSYNLYKWGLLKFVPVAAVAMLFAVLAIENRGGNIALFLAVAVELLVLASNFSIFLPSEMREEYAKWKSIFVVGERIIKRL